MNRLIKKVVAVATVLTMVAGPAMALTESQIDSILDLLESFGADSATVDNVESALRGEEVTPVTPTVSGCTITSFDRNLSVGMSGDDVKCLQIVLNSDSDTQLAESGVGSPGEETSYFGPLTKAAVIKFQELYSEDVLESWGLTEGTGYVGSTTRAKLNELLAAEEEEEEEEVPEVGLGVSLDDDTPAAASIPANVDNVLFTKINFTAGEEGDVTVSSITVTRTGLGADDDLSAVTLYEGSDKLGTTRTTFNSLHQMTFNIAGGWTIPSGETKTLDIRASASTTGTYNALGIAASDDINSDASEISGTFPIYGNEMSAVTVTVAEMTVEGEGISSQTKYIGTDDVTLASFSLENDDVEDVEFNAITLRNKGTCRDSDIANLYLKEGANVLAGPVSMSRDYVAFELDEPYEIEKSDKETFKVVGDLVNGDGYTVEFILKNDIDLECVGQTYGYNASVVRGDYDETSDSGTTETTIEGAQMNLNMESSPFETADEVKNLVFATLELTATGEDTRITLIQFDMEETDGGNDSQVDDVDELELLDEDGSAFGMTVVSGGGDSTAGAVTWKCEDEIYLTEDVTKTLRIRGDIPTATGQNDGDKYRVAMTVNTTYLEAEGVDSGDTIDQFSVSQLTGKYVTVKTPYLAILSSALQDGTSVIDATDVLVFQGTLKAGAASDITVDRMLFRGWDEGGSATDTAYFDKDNISKVDFIVDDEVEQSITYNELTDGTADFDELEVVVPASDSKSFKVEADIRHTLDSSNTTVQLALTTVSAEDEDGDDASVLDETSTAISESNALATARTISLYDKGLLKVAMVTDVAGYNKDRYVLAGETDDYVAKIKVRAENEPILIEDLVLYSTSTDAEDSVNYLALYLDGTDTEDLVGTSVLAGTDQATWNDVNVTIPLGTHYLYVKAAVRKIGTEAAETADSGDYLEMRVNSITARGDESEEALEATDAGGPAAGYIVYDTDENGSYATGSDTLYSGYAKERKIVGTKISAVEFVSSYGGYTVDDEWSGTGEYNGAILKVSTDYHSNTTDEGVVLKTLLSTIQLYVEKSASTTITAMTIDRIGGTESADSMTLVNLGDGNSTGTATTTSTGSSGSGMGPDSYVESDTEAYFLVKATIGQVGSGVDFWKIGIADLDGGDLTWKDGQDTHPDGGDPSTMSDLRLDETEIDGIRCEETQY